MKLELPAVVQTYIDSTNRPDIEAVLSCFSDGAAVQDEAREYRGAEEIEDWIATTIEKYKFQIKPVSVSKREVETLVAMEVSGTFPGSPITLDYRFAISGDKISSLTIS
ncbi:MAG TPA: nuclear transport factor 2 family protein [Chthoniobacterales bacterium]|nr:nuclear transport factor 2 family protein [Chthoniobacterales bacterium]